ncbi:MAG: hypothetical protein ACOC06_03420, partial [Halorubrum sp.]
AVDGVDVVERYDADPDVEPTTDGALAYRIVHAVDGDAGADDGRAVAEVYVQPDRVRIEFVGLGGDAAEEADLPKAAADAAGEASLRVRPKAVRPPRTLVFVEDGAQVKRALPVLSAVVDAT